MLLLTAKQSLVMAKKSIIGITEKVTIIGEESVTANAIFDTGARLTSIDIKLAAKAKIGPIIRTTRVKNPSTKIRTRRPVVKVRIRIRKKEYEVEANLQDRSHMTLPVIIGRNLLMGEFIVDPEKNIEVFKKMRAEKRNPEKQGLRTISYFR